MSDEDADYVETLEGAVRLIAAYLRTNGSNFKDVVEHNLNNHEAANNRNVSTSADEKALSAYKIMQLRRILLGEV